jgi:hypothetical protein
MIPKCVIKAASVSTDIEDGAGQGVSVYEAEVGKRPGVWSVGLHLARKPGRH